MESGTLKTNQSNHVMNCYHEATPTSPLKQIPDAAAVAAFRQSP
jgi:hypothetical protein